MRVAQTEGHRTMGADQGARSAKGGLQKILLSSLKEFLSIIERKKSKKIIVISKTIDIRISLNLTDNWISFMRMK